jgi:hypothetical protein
MRALIDQSSSLNPSVKPSTHTPALIHGVRGFTVRWRRLMKADGDRLESRGPEALAKKPYSSPRIDDYGSVVELTGTGSGSIPDGGGPFDSSGAAG